MTNEQLIEKARNQMECHQRQVSGAWSINAEDFCKEAGVDYDTAVDYQILREAEDNEEYEAEVINRYTRNLGYLTDKQLENIRNDTSLSVVNDSGYSAYFWQNVVEQLESQPQPTNKRRQALISSEK